MHPVERSRRSLRYLRRKYYAVSRGSPTVREAVEACDRACGYVLRDLENRHLKAAIDTLFLRKQGGVKQLQAELSREARDGMEKILASESQSASGGDLGRKDIAPLLQRVHEVLEQEERLAAAMAQVDGTAGLVDWLRERHDNLMKGFGLTRSLAPDAKKEAKGVLRRVGVSGLKGVELLLTNTLDEHYATHSLAGGLTGMQPAIADLKMLRRYFPQAF